MVNMASGLDLGGVRATLTTTTNDDDVTQHGGHTLANTKSRNACLQRTSLILDIHAMLNWLLSKQDIHWPVSHDHIADSSLKLMEIMWFLKDQVLVYRSL